MTTPVFTETIVFIRMFANDEDFDGDYERPYYAAYSIREGGGVDWTLTRNFKEAAKIGSVDMAKGIVRSVPEFRKRIDRAWGYQVVHVVESIIETNIEFEDELEEAEAA